MWTESFVCNVLCVQFTGFRLSFVSCELHNWNSCKSSNVECEFRYKTNQINDNMINDLHYRHTMNYTHWFWCFSHSMNIQLRFGDGIFYFLSLFHFILIHSSYSIHIKSTFSQDILESSNISLRSLYINP